MCRVFGGTVVFPDEEVLLVVQVKTDLGGEVRSVRLLPQPCRCSVGYS